jgi:hypothetical protein
MRTLGFEVLSEMSIKNYLLSFDRCYGLVLEKFSKLWKEIPPPSS